MSMKSQKTPGDVVARGVCGHWIALAVGAVLSFGASARGDVPATAGANEAAIKKVFAESIQPGQPGCGVGVMRDGKLLHTSGHGVADVAERKPIGTGSVFNIASISKQFTAFSILLLDERKALSIDDPLTKHVPELAASARGVTLRHLIHHTGGLRDYERLLMLRGRRMSDGATQFETIQTLSRQRAPNSPPGKEYVYSNTGYVLLATVVERVSGRSMKQFAAENIFQPLGMKHTTIIDRYPAQLPKLARGYTPSEKKESKGKFDIDESAWEQVGDGQVHTTTADLLLWAENFHTGRVGGQKLMKRAVEVGVLNSGEKIDYASGLVVGEHNGLPTVSHGGGWAGYVSEFLTFPEQHFAVSVLCNRNDLRPSQLAASVAEIYLADEMRRTGKKSKPERYERELAPAVGWKPTLADFEGAYWSDEAEARCVLVERDGQLFIEGCMPGHKLQPASDREFYVPDNAARLRFESAAGKPTGFTLQTYGLNALAFKRQ